MLFVCMVSWTEYKLGSNWSGESPSVEGLAARRRRQHSLQLVLELRRLFAYCSWDESHVFGAAAASHLSVLYLTVHRDALFPDCPFGFA